MWRRRDWRTTSLTGTRSCDLRVRRESFFSTHMRGCAGKLNPSNAEATFIQEQGWKDFWKQYKPCHVGIHRIAFAEYSQMSTYVPGFQSIFRVFLHPFVLAKLAISIRLSMKHSKEFIHKLLSGPKILLTITLEFRMIFTTSVRACSSQGLLLWSSLCVWIVNTHSNDFFS